MARVEPHGWRPELSSIADRAEDFFQARRAALFLVSQLHELFLCIGAEFELKDGGAVGLFVVLVDLVFDVLLEVLVLKTPLKLANVLR